VPIEGSPPSLISPPSGCPFHPRCPHQFPPCITERPPLIARDATAHLDACHLAWHKKVELGSKRSLKAAEEVA
jgi:oligopeptide/dipeptide ABC transporter ATP-binding protein